MHGDRRVQQDRRFVAIERHLGAPGSARQLANRREHRLARGGYDVLADRVERLEAKLAHHRSEPLRRHGVARDERQQIAPHLLRLAHVRREQIEERAIQLALLHDAHMRHQQPLLVHCRRIGGEAFAADVDHVAGGGKEADQPLLEKRRRDDDEVEEMPGAEPRVVGGIDIARAHAGDRKALEEMRHRHRHGVDMARRAGDRLREHPPAHVVDAGREIARLARDRAEGRLQEHLRLLFDERDQAVPDDLALEGLTHIAHGRAFKINPY